jgi:serine/threonine protein kinase
MIFCPIGFISKAITQLEEDFSMWRRGEITPRFILDTLSNLKYKIIEIKLHSKTVDILLCENFEKKIEELQMKVLGQSYMTCGRRIWVTEYASLDAILEANHIDPKSLQLLGRGAFKAVYRIGTTDLVVKIFLSDVFRMNSPYDAAVAQEKHAVAFFHPNIARVVSRIMNENERGEQIFVAVVQQYISGVRLDKKGITNFMTLQDIMCQIMLAITYIHSQGFALVDVKDSNLVVKDDGTRFMPVIVDFDRCTPLSGYQKQEGGLWGYYFAPELYKKTFNYDERVDSWGFGLILWNKLTGNLYTEDARQFFTKVARNLIDQEELYRFLFSPKIFKCENHFVKSAQDLLSQLMLIALDLAI